MNKGTGCDYWFDKFIEKSFLLFLRAQKSNARFEMRQIVNLLSRNFISNIFFCKSYTIRD